MQLRKAYTLMEMLLVVAIILILAGLAYPTVTGMYGYYQLQAGADAVRAGWVGARSHAVEEGQRYRFAVVPGKGNFRVAPDDPTYWSGSVPEFDHDNPPLMIENALPRGIVFTLGKGTSGGGSVGTSDGGDTALPIGGVDQSMWKTILTFDVDGTTDEDTSITLSYPGEGTRPIIVSIRSLTGISTAKGASLEGQR